MTRLAYGYLRVSSQRQVDEGESLGVQKRRIEAIATLEGYALAGVFIEEGVSAGKPLQARPEGKRLLDTVKRGDIVISLKLDRVFRDLEDATSTLKQLKRAGIGLHLHDLGGDVTTGGVSELVFNLLASVAQFERTRIGERVSDVKADLKSQGRYLGGKVPFAHTIEWSVCPDAGKRLGHIVEDVEVSTFVRDLDTREYSSRMIAVELNMRGYQGNHNTVARFLRQDRLKQAA